MPPDIAEAIALIKVMLLCKDIGFNDVLFEGDCLKMINVVINKLPTHDALCPIIHDILHLILDDQNWKVSYVSRNLNRGVDSFASFARITHFDLVWVEECPLILSI